MEKVTRWSPDTCGCVIEFAWDTEDIPTETHDRTLTPVNVLKRCTIHEALGIAKKPKDIWDTVLEENRRKNRALTMVQDRYPEISGFVWSFDDKRVVHIKSPVPLDQNPGRLSSVQSLLDSELGAGKVFVG